MKKPIGVIISAVILSLATLGFLLMAATMFLVGIFQGRNPTTSAAPMPHLFIYIFAGMAIFYIALALWSALTAYGILRLRRWARYSMLVIGACLAFFSLMSIAGLALSYFTGLQIQPNRQIFAAVMLVMVFIELIFAAIGVWWFVYFMRHPIRELFDAANSASLPYPAPGLNLSPSEAYSATPPPIAYPTVPYKTYTGFLSSPEHAPAAIKILGWFFLVATLCSIPIIFLPIPCFMFGLMIPTPVSHPIYLAFTVLNACIGYGLLKLKNWARLTGIAWVAIGLINTAMSMLPASQNKFLGFAAELTNKINSSLPTIPGQPSHAYAYSASMLIFYSAIGFAFNLAILWLLLHYRSAFTTQSQNQPESVEPTY